MATIEITTENLAQTVTDNDIVLLDFWASWCGPCRQFGPVFEQSSENHPEVVFGKIDIDAQPQIAAEAGVQSVPTVMAFRAGIPVFQQAGALPGAALEDIIKQISELDIDQVRAEYDKQAQNEN